MPENTYALTDLARAQEFMLARTSSNNYSDERLIMLINAVSAEIESFLGRNILSRDYTEYVNGGEFQHTVSNFPITAITRVAWGHAFVLTIKCSSTTATRATGQVTATALSITDVIAGVSTTNSITLASYATLTLLEAAIDAVTNWEATTSPAYLSYPAADLIRTPPKDCLRTTSQEFAIWEEDANVDQVDFDTGILYFNSVTPTGRDTVRVSYTAGYTTTPDDLEMVVLDLITRTWDAMQRDRTLQSERLADYAWTARGMLKDRDIQHRLGPYMNYGF